MNTLLSTDLGPEALFLKAYRECREPVYRAILSLAGNKQLAEDIMQDVFSKLWLERASLAVVKNPSALLFTMARNHYFNLMARRKLESEVVANITSSRQPFDLEADLLKKEKERLLQLAIQQLSPQKKKIFILAQLEGRSRQEIATLLKISPFTVKAILQQARAELRAAMAKKLSLKEKAKLKKIKKNWEAIDCLVA